MLFLLALKSNFQEEAFSNVKTRTNLNFAVKLTERSKHSFLLSIWWITFFKHLYVIMKCIEVTWSCKHMEKVRSSQAAILILNWVKHSFSLWVSLIRWNQICFCHGHIISIYTTHLMYESFSKRMQMSQMEVKITCR